MKDEKLKMIKKTGRCTHPPAGRQAKGEWVVVCQGCGKMISSNDPDEGVEFTVTKRGSVYFFHTNCMKAAMNGPIRYDKELAKHY